MPSPVVCVHPAPESRLAGWYAGAELADAFAVALPAGATGDTGLLAQYIFTQQPRWVDWLMAVRDAAVRCFGLKTAHDLRHGGDAIRDERIGIFKVYRREARETILGEDDKHLDFRVSLLCRSNTQPRLLVVTTAVHCHSLLGRIYIILIRPFHRLVVKGILRRATRLGWPSAGGTGQRRSD